MATSPTFFLFASSLILLIPSYLIYNLVIVPGELTLENELLKQLLFLQIISFFSLVVTLKFIPVIMKKCLKADMFGYDINKEGKIKVPEALGIVPALIHLMSVISFQWIFRENLGVYNAALTSLCLMLFLGFADDVLDVRWRDKIVLSFVATLPLMIGYDGETTILLPKPLHLYFGSTIELGILYYVYMAMTAVFCTNSINIYAGINGLETGQTAVMAFFVLLHNCLQISTSELPLHLLSIYIMLPFFASTMGLLYFNWYPSRAFVGDSFTYFAGMAFAVSGILGHFSKTLMIIFIPQFINFILSLPQLFHIVECPRHRLPRFNKEDGKLYPTYNFTLINAWLYLFGPRTEKNLCVHLVLFQIVCCSLALVARSQAIVYFY